MMHTHLKVTRDFTGTSGCIYRKGEVYEIIERDGSNGFTIRNSAGKVVLIDVRPGCSFLPYSPYSDNLKTILE